MGVSKQHRSVTCLQVIRLRQTLAAQENQTRSLSGFGGSGEPVGGLVDF